ncbi:MAG: hypothetical protein LLF94_08785 [Chlamydiales bacterium]|nr:hypothetical protein [Chlamydiales bacterium]
MSNLSGAGITNGYKVNPTQVGSGLYADRRKWNDQLVAAKTDSQVIALWQAHGTQFSCVNVSTALISFAKWDVTLEGESCIVSILRHYIENRELIRMRDAAGVVNSLAKIRFTEITITSEKEALFRMIHIPHHEWSWSKKQHDLYIKELFVREYKPTPELI